jgi:transcriptional regulator with XRE-family HTH domain
MRLDEYRKEKELSQRQFGELLEPPVSPSLVSQWECGVTRITLDYAHEIQSKTDNRVTTQDCAAMFIESQPRKKAEA